MENIMRNAIIILALAACGEVKAPEMADGGSNGMPALSISAHVQDERGDSIDFTSGIPVHTHNGGVIDLGSGCPDVYKYAYLLDPNGPAFGSETSPNPLRWHVDVRDLDTSTIEYRVRDASSTVLDWTKVDSDPQGELAFSLYRSGLHGIAELSQREGQMYVDVRAQDPSGNAMTATNCWIHHPLAAPLDISPLQKGSLFDWTLGKWGISILLDNDPSFTVPVLVVDIRQPTAEPVILNYAFNVPQPTYQMTAQYARSLIDSSATSGSISCSSPSTTAACATAQVPFPSQAVRSGTLASGKWKVSLYSPETGAIPACTATDTFSGTCSIPPRATGDAHPPHYSLVVQLNDVTDLWPATAGPFDEHELIDESAMVTSDQFTEIGQCMAMNNGLCTQWTDYYYFHALTAAEFYWLDPVSVQFRTRANDDVAFVTTPYVDPASLSLANLIWYTAQNLP